LAAWSRGNGVDHVLVRCSRHTGRMADPLPPSASSAIVDFERLVWIDLKSAARHVDADGLAVSPPWLPLVPPDYFDGDKLVFALPSLTSMAGLEDVPIVAVIGERGSGKSTLFFTENRHQRGHGLASELIDFRRVASPAWLSEELLAARNSLRARASSSGGRGANIYLYLDLDEGLPATPCARTIARTVCELRAEFGSRLRVRISCRPPSWGVYADALARDVHRPVSVGVPEVFLAPLALGDVRRAAQAVGLDPAAVLATIRKLGIGPIAARPATLFMLLERLHKGGSIPQTLSELLDEAVRGLCQRPMSETRAIPPGHLALGVRRIAAGLHLSGSMMLSLNGTPAPGVLALEDLLGSEPGTGANVQVDWDVAQAAVDTGVFTATGTDTLAFAHQIYADHLTSQWLLAHVPTPRHLVGIVTGQGGDGKRRVLPRLSDLAAMLAGAIPGVFDELLHIDPNVLLRCDSREIDDEQRARIVRALMNLEEWPTPNPDEDSALPDSDDDLLWEKFVLGLRALSCPAAVKVVRDVLVEGDAAHWPRACLIVAHWRDHGLNPILLGLATDQANQSDLRCAALRALHHPLSAEHASQLAMVADVPSEDECVFAAALSAGWPRNFSLEVVTTAIERRIALKCGDSRTWLPYFHLPAADSHELADLLAWTTAMTNTLADERGAELELEWLGSKAACELLARCHDDIDPRVHVLVVDALVAACLDPVEPSRFQDILQASPELRRRLGPEVLAKLPASSAPGKRPSLTSLAVAVEDLGWFAEFIMEQPAEQRSYWCKPLIDNADLLDEDVFEALWRLGDCIPEIAVLLDERCVVQIDDRRPSQIGQAEESVHEGHVESPPPADAALFTYSARALAAALDSDLPLLERWDAVCSALPRSTPTVISRPDAPNADLVGRLPYDLRQRFLDLAQEVIFTLPIDVWEQATAFCPDDPHMARFLWLIDAHVWAGGTAWCLAFDARPDMAAQVAPERGCAWLRIMLYTGEDCYCEDDLVVPRRVISALAANLSPGEAATVILDALSDLSTRYGPTPTAITLLRDTWHPGLVHEVLDRLEQIPPACALSVLRPLIESGSIDAAHVATTILADQGRGLQLRGHVAQAMLFSETTCTVAIETMLLDSSLSLIALSTLNCSHDLESSHWPEPIAAQPPECLGRLCLHLNGLYPKSRSLDSTRYCERELRDEVPSLIAQQGTWGAVRVLRGLADAGIAGPWEELIDRAERAALARERHGRQISVIEQLAVNGRHRFVENSAQLLDAVVEALEDFHSELHGEIPLVSSLWDQIGTRQAKFKPKNEAKLSDEVARWLRRSFAGSALVVNREVQVRRLRESPQGESADIVVQAGATGSDTRTATVVIEVKGGWNGEVSSAMRTQLTERYLAQQPDAAGLYVVGWYLCPEWDHADQRRYSAHSALGSIEVLRDELSAQARALQGRFLVRPHVLDLRITPPAPRPKLNESVTVAAPVRWRGGSDAQYRTAR
jgi:hypothetical protein